MDTQLVRHDAPYNIICGKNGKFGLHTATLIVVKETMKKAPDNSSMSESLSVSSYPVVSGGYEIDGHVWTDVEQKDCMVIARKGEPVAVGVLKRIMEFCTKRNYYNLVSLTASFKMAMFMYGSKISLPTDKEGKTISDYEVCLEFEFHTSSYGYVIVYSSKESVFYFLDEYEEHGMEPEEAMRRMVKLRDNYLNILYNEGLRSITFITKDKLYQDFIDKLNSYKVDEGV